MIGGEMNREKMGVVLKGDQPVQHHSPHGSPYLWLRIVTGRLSDDAVADVSLSVGIGSILSFNLSSYSSKEGNFTSAFLAYARATALLP